MKKLYTFLFLLVLCASAYAQTASVQWDCVVDQNPTTVVGNIQAQPQVGKNFEVRDYTGGNITGPLSTNHQRWWPGKDAAGSGIKWGPETVPLADRYIQLEVAPKSGNNFTVKKVELYMGAGGTNMMRANVAYSIMADFSQSISIADTIKLKQGSAKPEDTLIVFNGNVEVKSGGKFLVRIFPWYTGASSNSKYVYLQKLYIEGTTAPGTGVEENILPLTFNLDQNYPNPFNPETVISYQLPVASYVTLKVYDVLGKEVITLADEFKKPGKYSTLFVLNSSFASGIYFYKLTAGNFTAVKKMILTK